MTPVFIYLLIGVLLYGITNVIAPDPNLNLKTSIALVLLWPHWLALVIYECIRRG